MRLLLHPEQVQDTATIVHTDSFDGKYSECRGSVDKGLAFHMDVGDRVVVLGEIRIYERDGQYQLYAQQVTRDGVGILYQKFMERKKELEEMGMFAQEYKRDIPRYASRVGIVTAPTGAAIRSINF